MRGNFLDGIHAENRIKTLPKKIHETKRPRERHNNIGKGNFSALKARHAFSSLRRERYTTMLLFQSVRWRHLVRAICLFTLQFVVEKGLSALARKFCADD